MTELDIMIAEAEAAMKTARDALVAAGEDPAHLDELEVKLSQSREATPEERRAFTHIYEAIVAAGRTER